MSMFMLHLVFRELCFQEPTQASLSSSKKQIEISSTASSETFKHFASQEVLNVFLPTPCFLFFFFCTKLICVFGVYFHAVS